MVKPHFLLNTHEEERGVGKARVELVVLRRGLRCMDGISVILLCAYELNYKRVARRHWRGGRAVYRLVCGEA